jgi:hypothetical protein
MAGAAYGLWLLPSGRRDAFVPAALVLTGLAFVLPVLREEAGMHSWVDTGFAVLLGAAIGFGTAALHLRTDQGPPSGEPPIRGTSATPLSVAGVF